MYTTESIDLAVFICSSNGHRLTLDSLSRNPKTQHVVFHFKDPLSSGETAEKDYMAGRPANAFRQNTMRSRLMGMVREIKRAEPTQYVKVFNGGQVWELTWPRTPEQTAILQTASTDQVARHMRSAIRRGASVEELQQIEVNRQVRVEAHSLTSQPLPPMASAYLDEGEL